MNINSELILDGSKVLWHRERIEQWLRGERIAPITIDCALSSNCTYNCEYCYGKMQRMSSGCLPRDVVMHFLDDAAEIGVKAISFVSDGESTCNPHLLEAVQRGRANGINMALATNGYLLKDDELPDLLPKLTYLRFNISSGTETGYCKIHGVKAKAYYKVIETICKAVAIKKENNLDVTIGLQMVLMPSYRDEVMPLAQLGKELGVDYFVIKHCSDDENGTLGVDYTKYEKLVDVLQEAEKLSTENYFVKAKWSKILSDGKRCYSRCYGPPFILQLSGSGLVAPCGMFFNQQYKRYHIGSLLENSFKEIWQSERYWDVMKELCSEPFDARVGCGTLCVHHKTNEILDSIMKNGKRIPDTAGPLPNHLNFI